MPGMTDAEFLGSGAPPPGGGMSDAEFMGATPGSPSAAPTMASSAQQWAKDISTVRPDQSASMFGTPVTQRQDTYGQQVKAYWDEGVRKAKEGLGRVMEATDPLKPHMGPFGTVGGLGEAASGAVSALASPVTAVTNPAWEYATGIPGEKAINALGAGTPVRGAGALNLRPRAPVPEINPAIPPRGSALALPGTLQRPPVVDMGALEASLAGPAAERAPTASAAPSEASGTRLLPPEAPHESYSGRASVGAAGNENPLADYSPQTIAKLRGDLQQAFPTPHLLEQAIEERSAHHTLGELSPDLEAKMGGLAASSGPERAEIVSALAQRAREGKDRMRAVLDRGFGPAQNRFELAKRLKTQQAEESKPFWDAFKRTVITPTPELEALMPRLKAAGALQAANKALRIEGLPETHWFEGRELGTEVRVPTATAFQYAKEHLDDLIERAMAAPGGANETRRLAQLKTDLVNAIDRHPDPNTAGVWKAAREAYAPASQIEKAMRLGERVLTGHVHEDELPFLTASFGPNETAAMKIGMRNYLEDRFGKPGKVERGTINTILAPSNQKKIAWAIGDEAADRIVAAIEHEQSMLDAPGRIHGNSQTMARSEARKEWVPGPGPLDRLGGVSLGDVAGAVVHPGKTAGKMAAKVGLNKFAARKEAEFAKLREEAARIYTLQGAERDAVARALLGSEEGPIGPAAVSSGPRPWEPPARFTAPPVARNPQKTAAYARYEAPPKEEKIAPAKVDLSRGKKLEKDTSLFQFLAHHGGLKETPDLRSILDGNPLVPGYGRLLRKNGLTEDHAREIAVEAGFLPETSGSGVNTSSISDLHEAIRDEAHGKRRYRLGVAPEAKVDAAENQRLRDEHIDAAFHDDGIPPPTGALRDRVAELVFREGVEDPLEAYERAVMEEHYAGRNEATTLPGIPKGIPGWELPDEPGPASPGGHGASPARRPKGEAAGAASRHAGERNRAPAAGTGAKAVKPPPFASGGAVRPPLSTRKQSNYSPTAGTKARHCGPCKAWPNGSCSMYREHNKCTAVVGFIAAKGACDWWEKGVPHRADGGALSDDDIASMTHQPEQPNPAASAVDMGKLIAKHLWDKAVSAATAPRDALYGNMQVTDPETGMPTREAMGRAQGVANMAMTGGIPFAQRGAAGIFGGRLAQTADQAALKQAEEMAAKGHPKEDIWNATGWFKGADDKWRFEIPDEKSALKQPLQSFYDAETAKYGHQAQETWLPNLLQHDELMAAYPNMDRARLFVGDSRSGTARGAYQGTDMEGSHLVGIQPKEGKTTLLHELQHAVQNDEGFAAGSSPYAQMQPINDRLLSLYKQLQTTDIGDPNRRVLQAAYDALRDQRELTAMDLYRRHAGEVEARNVQSRMNMTPEERKAKPPWTTEDTPREQQIVRMGGNGPQMSLPERKGLKVADDGIRINIAPRDMQVPEWGKGLSWGLTAYRSKVNGEDAIHVRDARLPPEMRGQGHGTAMYEHAADLAAKEGKPLLSDGTVTQDAANRWMALNRAGYNVQMAPNKVFRPGPPEAPQLGRFETPDGSPVFRVKTAPPGITAYHGSPHDFDKFDLSKIGTGEGAQAYGHGLYFAENEGVAKQYRDTLTATRVPDAAYLDPELGSKLTASEQRMKEINNQIMEARFAGKSEQSINKLRTILDKATNNHLDLIEKTKFPGRMYQVAIKAPPEHFLDWDKPLDAEHPARAHLNELADMGLSHHEYGADRNLAKNAKLAAQNPNLTGEGLYRQMSNAIEAARPVLKQRGDPRALFGDLSSMTSTKLREAGIPGIKYLDQGSRGKGDGTRNYVVFDDKLIDILKKYGLAGLAALPAAGAYHFQDKDIPKRDRGGSIKFKPEWWIKAKARRAAFA